MQIPDSTFSAGYYHIHPSPPSHGTAADGTVTYVGSEQFSVSDMNLATSFMFIPNASAASAYLASPSGLMQKFTPRFPGPGEDPTQPQGTTETWVRRDPSRMWAVAQNEQISNRESVLMMVMIRRMCVHLVLLVFPLLTIEAQVRSDLPPVDGQCLPASNPEIRDPAERERYQNALNVLEPTQRAAALAAFLRQYPGTKARVSALEQIMMAYHDGGDLSQLTTATDLLLESDPVALRGLVMRVSLSRGATDDSRWVSDAKRGLKVLATCLRPQDMSVTAFRQTLDDAGKVLYSAAGFAAVQAKDYVEAREDYLRALSLAPGNIQDLYYLGIAELQMKPLDPTGFWHIAKAVNLARTQRNRPAADAMFTYGRNRYRAYHGSEDGWARIVMEAATQSQPPYGFNVVPTTP